MPMCHNIRLQQKEKAGYGLSPLALGLNGLFRQPDKLVIPARRGKL